MKFEPSDIEALRPVAMKEPAQSSSPVALFHKAFMRLLRKSGRVHETALAAAYKSATGTLMSGLDMAAALLLKRKLPLLPRRMRDRRLIDELCRSEKPPAEEKS